MLAYSLAIILLSFFLLTVSNRTVEAPPEAQVPMTMSGSKLDSDYVSPQVPLDTEGYPVAPGELVLEQVHVFVRHGERTPVGVRMADPPGSIPEYWKFCKEGRQFRAAVTSLMRHESPLDETLTVRRVLERVNGTVADGECMLGELTDVGRRHTYNYGKALRNIYVDKLGFLADTLQDPNQVYFRSTNMPRTVESLQSVVHGLYPMSKCAADLSHQILIRNGKDENLVGNEWACKRLEVLLVSFGQAAASSYNHTLERLDGKIAKYLGGNPIRIDGKPRASGVLDTIRAAKAHGIKVPPEFEEKPVIDLIERAVVAEWFGDKVDEVRRLGVGRILGDISRKMKHKVDKGAIDPLKILVHSTHDSALAAMCSAFDVFDEKWPAFTSSVTFELFRRPEGKAGSSYLQNLFAKFSPWAGGDRESHHYVRMRYQNKNMILPLCAAEGNHLPGSPEFCSLSVFRQRVAELTPVNFEAECDPAGK